VNRSVPIDCLTDPETDESYASDAKPDTESELEKALADSKDFIAKCEEKNEYLNQFSTANAARDMDILRAALGDKKLNFFGKSYGTYLGTLYAQFFPDKVGRMVLDGAVDPNISILEQNISQAVGFDEALNAFLADCANQDDGPLPANRQEATAAIITLLTKSAVNPLPRKTKVENDERVATESLIVLGTASALYDDVDGWPKLRTAFLEGQRGFGDTFLDLADQYTGRSSDGTYGSNELDSGAIIDCLDWPDTRSIEKTKAEAKRFSDVAPVFGPYVAYSGITCNMLNTTIGTKPANIDQNTAQIRNIATPILVIGTTQDPATPYEWAKSLSNYIAGSHLITLKGEGHTGYGRGSACTDDAVDAYLINGTTPAKNLICTQ
jgi:pimeloyl-ACP methyl ester carboxylesterase